MRLEKRGIIVMDDRASDPVIFESREELGKELNLMDFEVKELPSGILYLYSDGSLYDEDRRMIWDKADAENTLLMDGKWDVFGQRPIARDDSGINRRRSG